MSRRQTKKVKYVETDDEDEEIIVVKKQKVKSASSKQKQQKSKKSKMDDDDDDEYQPNIQEEKELEYDLNNEHKELDLSLSVESDQNYEQVNQVKNKRNSQTSKKQSTKSQKFSMREEDEIDMIDDQQPKFREEEFLENAEKILPYFIQEGFVKDENGNEPGDPDYDPSTLHIPIQAFQKLSPMFKQYWNAKKNHYDSIVMFRFGRWRYAFYRDALVVGSVMGKGVGFWGKDRPVITIYDSQYPIVFRGLLERGLKICIIEQVEKGELRDKEEIAKREISQLISKGTWQDADDDEYSDQRFLMVIVQGIAPINSKYKYIYGVSLVDSTTNDFYVDQFMDDEYSNNLRALLMKSKPLEVIVEQGKLSQEIEKMIKNVCYPVFYQYKKQPKDIQHVFLQLKKEFIEEKQESNQFDNRKIHIPSNQIQPDIKVDTNVNQGIYEEEINPNKESSQFVKKTLSLSLDYPELLQQFEVQYNFELESHTKKLQQNQLSSQQIEDFQKNEYSFYYSVQSVYMVQFYLRQLLLSDTVYRRGRFQLIDSLQQQNYLFLDSQALESLEIFQANLQTKIQEKGSLFSFLNKCGSGMGRRLLRKWLSQPLYNHNRLMERQQCIVDLVKNIECAHEFTQKIQGFPDFERAIARVFNSSQSARLKAVSFTGETFGQTRLKEVSGLLKNLRKVGSILQLFQTQRNSFLSKRLSKLTKMKSIEQQNKKRLKKKNKKEVDEEDEGIFPDLEEALLDLEGCLSIRDGVAIPKTGVSEEYDQSHEKVQEVHKELDNQLNYWRKKMNCDEICYFQGKLRYQLEIPERAVEGNKKPKELVITSKKKGFQRFQTEKIEELIFQLKIAEQDEQTQLVPFLQEFFQKFYSYKNLWYQMISCLSELDCLCSIALTSKGMKVSCIPVFLKADQEQSCSFDIKSALHPCLVESMPNIKWVPNDISFSKDIDCLLLTGPNMSGKSTLLRLTAISAILAQIGCYVPASSFTLLPFDRIFCRIGASDRLLEGKSTFFIEMEETKTILQSCTSRSLVIVDELGRGTSTYDGVAIASSVLKYLTTHLLPKTIFATHYHILLDEFALYRNIRNTVMKHYYEENSDKVVFTFHLVEGQAEKSFAANVARIAGIPNNVVKRALEIEQKISKEEEKLSSNRMALKLFNNIIERIIGPKHR